MKNHPKSIFILIGILISQASYGQNRLNLLNRNPFDLLKKAAVQIEKGQFEKALKKIETAENIKYNTCGTTAIQLNKEINLLKYTIYFQTKRYKLARQSLDSIYYPSSQFDSLKILTYQLEYGKEFLSKAIDFSLENSTISYTQPDYYIEIPLGINKIMKFKLNYDLNIPEMTETEKIEKWKKVFLESSMYRIIKENS